MHCAMVRHYKSLIQELDMFMHLSTVSADEKKQFIDRIHQQLNKLFDLQPEPSVLAIRQFEQQYKTNIETAMFDAFETAALHNAAYVERRLSRIKPSVRVSLVAQGSQGMRSSQGAQSSLEAHGAPESPTHV